eukprot:GEMP01034028.1.p1 GENE.GEMP01034028.1~~GEMP01034028.1.p1  ORF type:complete len:284 (+),score=72.24 GEMP01034028.1:132-983(+)
MVSFAAFAQRCLGVTTPQEAGAKMGVMGNCYADEMSDLIRFLKTQFEKRESGDWDTVLGETFGGAEKVIAGLPRCGDKIDLISMFELGATDGAAKLENVPLLEDPAALADGPKGDLEGSWLERHAALNELRRQLYAEDLSVPLSHAAIDSIAENCRSPRPALAKTALFFLSEYYADDRHVPTKAVFAAILIGGFKTKATAKSACTTLYVCTRREDALDTLAEVVKTSIATISPSAAQAAIEVFALRPECVAARESVFQAILGSRKHSSLFGQVKELLQTVPPA